MPLPSPGGADEPSLTLLRHVDDVCVRFEAAWQAAVTATERPRIETFLGAVPQTAQPNLVNELVALEIDLRRRAGEHPQLDEYQVRFPFLAPPDQTSPPSSGPGPPALAQASVNIPGYDLIQELGRGGMGVVFKARQVSLHRLVALKMILAGQLASTADVQRFHTEAEAAGNLDHPNIVPIYEVGEHEGQHYFSMKLIDGGSLADVFTAWKERDGASWKVSAEAARLLASVAQAVHYAHQRGILHRDLKPANILLDKQGVPLVTDFGLAKRVAGGSNLTYSGAIVGTPSYMAPEQARGDKGVSTAADVYSLGAILYELLTGRRPFQAATPLETVLQVLEREPARPQALNAQVDRDLETVCLKCLEKNPVRRYGSAVELAEELERWARGEPIKARPVGALERGWRWCRRNPAVAALAAGVVFVLLAGSVISTFFAIQADRRAQEAEDNAAAERRAKQREAGERQKAEASQRQAMAALQATTDEVVEQLIGAKPALGPAEKAFLENVLKRWQTFAAATGDSKLAREVRAEGVFRVAYLRAKLGERAAAREGYREAMVLWEKLADAFPAVPLYRQNLATSHNNLGILLSDLGQRAEAEVAYRQAVSIRAKLAAAFPAVPQYRQQLATSHNNLGNLLSDLGKRAEAEAAHRQARSLLAKLVADFPGVPLYRQDLARSHNNLGLVLSGQGKQAEAEAAFRKARSLQAKLAADFPAVPQYRQELATSHTSLGNLLRGLGQRADAEAAYRQALSIQAKLVADFPAVPLYRHDLARSHNSMGNLFSDLGQHADAESAYRQALSIQAKLAADFPAVPQYRQELAGSHNNLGLVLSDLGQRAEAEAAYRQALPILDKLAADFPAVPKYRIDLGGSQVNFGHRLRANQQPEQALEWCAKAIANLESVLRKMKVDATARLFLRNAHWGRARALDALKRHAEAAADWDKAATLSPGPQRARFRMSRALSRVRAGQLEAALKEGAELAKDADADTLYAAACVFAITADSREESAGLLSREQCARRAVALLRQAVARGWKNAAHLRTNADLNALRGRDDFKKLLAELDKQAR